MCSHHRKDGEISPVPPLGSLVGRSVPLLVQSKLVKAIVTLAVQGDILSQGHRGAGPGGERGLVISSWERRELTLNTQAGVGGKVPHLLTAGDLSTVSALEKPLPTASSQHGPGRAPELKSLSRHSGTV